jgi:transcriptional regulator with XRE-family HTH domain
MAFRDASGVRSRLRKQLAAFLRKARGAQTYAQFARRVGISSSTLQRLEVAEQNVTLDTLEQIADRLNASVSEIFPGPRS